MQHGVTVCTLIWLRDWKPGRQEPSPMREKPAHLPLPACHPRAQAALTTGAWGPVSWKRPLSLWKA